MNNSNPQGAQPASSQNPNEQTRNQQLANLEKNVADSVLTRVSQLQEMGEIVLPPNYSPANALKAAWLMLLDVIDKNSKPALEVCTKQSVANALYEMVTKGLSVVKKQCYFVVYGNKLELEDSYIGKIAVAKRDANVREVNAVTIYKDDEFEYEIDIQNGGRKKVIKHIQRLQNIDMSKIVGAYAIVSYNDDSTDTEVMTIDQIRKSWEQGGSKGKSGAHTNFTDQMAEKTVIGRALKIPVNSTDDSVILSGSDKVASGVKSEIQSNANREELSVDDAPYEEIKDESAPDQPTFEQPIQTGPNF